MQDRKPRTFNTNVHHFRVLSARSFTALLLLLACLARADWELYEDFGPRHREWLYGGDIVGGEQWKPIIIDTSKGRGGVAVLRWKEKPDNDIDYAEIMSHFPGPIDVTGWKDVRYRLWTSNSRVLFYLFFHDGTNGFWSGVKMLPSNQWVTASFPIDFSTDAIGFNPRHCNVIKACLRAIEEKGSMGEGVCYIDDVEINTTQPGTFEPLSSVAPKLDKDGMKPRAKLGAGNPARLAAVLKNAAAGAPITVVAFGDSSARGTGASAPGKTYARAFVKWLEKACPKSKARLINAGLPGSGVAVGAHRVQRDVIRYKPDIVIVDFSLETGGEVKNREMYEGVLRQLLTAENKPAVILLFGMKRNMKSGQDWQAKLGHYYRLPMVSVRDALKPEIERGALLTEDVFATPTLFNDQGHKYAADFLAATVSDSRRAGVDAREESLPPALHSDVYSHVRLLDATTLEPVKNTGWEKTRKHRLGFGWQTDKPGAVIEFRVPGPAVGFVVYQTPKGGARVEVSLDDAKPRTVGNRTAAGRPPCFHFELLGQSLTPGQHTVRFKLEGKQGEKARAFIIANIAAGPMNDE